MFTSPHLSCVTCDFFLDKVVKLVDERSVKKRSRARVTIEVQCVLLKISLQIKMVDFFVE